MARKPKQTISQEEQSRRFLEAAREAGVSDDADLEGIVRKIAKRKSTESFTGFTTAEAERKLSAWRKAHPNATIIVETVTEGVGLEGTKSDGRKTTTIHIEFTE